MHPHAPALRRAARQLVPGVVRDAQLGRPASGKATARASAAVLSSVPGPLLADSSALGSMPRPCQCEATSRPAPRSSRRRARAVTKCMRVRATEARGLPAAGHRRVVARLARAVVAHRVEKSLSSHSLYVRSMWPYSCGGCVFTSRASNGFDTLWHGRRARSSAWYSDLHDPCGIAPVPSPYGPRTTFRDRRRSCRCRSRAAGARRACRLPRTSGRRSDGRPRRRPRADPPGSATSRPGRWRPSIQPRGAWHRQAPLADARDILVGDGHRRPEHGIPRECAIIPPATRRTDRRRRWTCSSGT